MKNIIYACLFFFIGNVWAQEEPKNVSEESTVKTIKTNDGSKIVEKKVKVTTREEQDIEFAKKDKNKRDKDVVKSPVKVKKTIEIDNNRDNSYDSKTEIDYYEFNGKQYGFKKVNSGFSILEKDREMLNSYGNILKFNKENHYLFQDGDNTGIGYFNEDGSFTIEYYDEDTKIVTSREFILVEK